MMGKRKKRPKLHHDDKGEFRWETYFVGGKQKRTKVRTIDGIDVDEFWRRNADPIALHQAGEYELLHELEVRNCHADYRESCEENEPSQAEDDGIDLPF